MAETTIQPLKADPKRQAHDQLRGYLYQIWHSVYAWLELAEDEILYLEGAEDLTEYQVTRLRQFRLKTQDAQSHSGLRKQRRRLTIIEIAD